MLFIFILKFTTMKKYFYLALIITIGFASCQDDDDIDPYLLHHDGENVGSPFLPPNIYEAGAHFTSNDVQRYAGKELIAIDYNIFDIPDYAEIRVSESTGSSVPGSIIFSRDVTNEIIPFSWNRLNIGNGIDLDGGLWISLYFETTSSSTDQQTIGCDAGPSNGNGDWLYDEADGRWLSYWSRVQESVNWNLQGILQDE